MGKGESNGYFGNHCSLRPESCYMQTTDEGHFLTLTQGHLNFKNKIMVFSLRNHWVWKLLQPKT